MRGAAMSLTAAASGLVVFLLSVSAVQSQYGWGVTYSSTQICAVKGSTVEINCSYRYPSTINHQVNTVQKTFWFTQKKDGEPVDLTTASEYAGRVEYLCGNNRCTLRIKNLTESDSAEYRFRLKTNKDAYTASPGVTLSVTDPDLLVKVMETMIHQSISRAKLQCHSRCLLPHDPSYIWYKNGQNIRGETSSSFSVYFDSADSFSCALKGHENFPSPSQCVDGQTCNRVIYNDRSICAFKGSSVDISCMYSHEYVQSKFWFSPERSHQGHNSSQPEDLSEDSQYAGRVQILETERGHSTLRISDLRDSDSAQYLFKFKTSSFEWGSDLPGTTLTVTDPDLKVKVQVHSSSWSKLQCYTSCRLPHGSSYIWYENGLKIAKETLSSYSVYFGFASSYSCAVRGHEDFPSPPVSLQVQVITSTVHQAYTYAELKCRSSCSPAGVSYVWFKNNEKIIKEERPLYKDWFYPGDIISCALQGRENYRSPLLYALNIPIVSVSPSDEIMEGSSVTLTCSSDANPAANYTWYKEDEDSPKASGQIFTITDFRAKHSGSYSCGAQNKLGRSNSTLTLIVVAGSSTTIVNIIRTTLGVLILIPVFLLTLWTRKKKALRSTTEAHEPEEIELDSDPEYENDSHTAAQTEDPEEQGDMV
ncbi:sialic acid-binding Ig-like lectin 6 [Gymnodraco acuticeps]|uniref:B-cell receptor CD22 n=1 Tax=Gymnodraco acuticeps TaxID=8218 RepID=A0A6P8U4L9_GYMAC|nr:sialic acid-binding Ig-like lectin 6 [Gymnodraco acuticeps]